MSSDYIYTSAEEAKEEIKKRWEDKELRQKIREFLGSDIPHFLQDSPKAYWARHVASPNFEFFLFKELADKMGLDFIISEFTDDFFVPENTLKYHLGKMFFVGEAGKKGGKKVATKKVINFNESNGKKIKEIKTLNGDSLVCFHHNLFKKYDKHIGFKIHDFSDWLKKYHSDPGVFYVYFLAFFIQNGILFENFLTNKEEGKFTLSKIIPCFQFLTEKFKVKPIIVRLLPSETETDTGWHHYAYDLKDNV
jgi:hypothetical protein